MKKLFAIAAAVTLVASAVGAAGHLDLIKQRQDLMGEVRGASQSLGGMARGRVDFDLAMVNATGERLVEIATIYPTLFIEGSEEGGQTKAGPAIWSDREGFEAEVAKLASAASGLASASDQATFELAFGEFGATCRSCHSTYQSR